MPTVRFSGRFYDAFGCILVGVAWTNESGFDGFAFGVMTPVRLQEHGVDLAEINGFGLVPNGFDERAPRQRFLTARKVPSELRVMRLRASSVKVACGRPA